MRHVSHKALRQIWCRCAYLDASYGRRDGEAEGADGGVDLLYLLEDDRVERLLVGSIE